MTASVAVELLDIVPELEDADIQARAWAMAKGVADSLADRVVLLHAAALSLPHPQTGERMHWTSAPPF